MDWLKDLSPTGLMAACLIYIVHYFGNCLSKVTTKLAQLCGEVEGMKAKVDDCPTRRGGG